jgi:small subunit ribosomal protein S4
MVYTNSKCKICRRVGQKLFLKGERCSTPKCPMVKRSYPPGKKGKRRPSRLSEYGKEFREKQKLKFWYGLRERQFKKYVKDILAKRKKTEDIDLLLIRRLESRLDNVIFRLGLAASRKQARKLITQKHFLVNGKPVNFPSFEVKKGDVISVKPKSLKKIIFQNLNLTLKKYQPPAWLELNKEKLEGKVIGEPSLEEINIPVEIPMILEFYSR